MTTGEGTLSELGHAELVRRVRHVFEEPMAVAFIDMAERALACSAAFIR